MTGILVTGGTGFVAGHVIDVLLKHGHNVVTTVRSQQKAQSIRSAFPGVSQEALKFVVVPDVAAKDAYQGLGAYGLEAAIHLASPFQYNVTDAKRDLIDPAVLGTTAVLEAIHQTCPTVRRVVVNVLLRRNPEPKTGIDGRGKDIHRGRLEPAHPRGRQQQPHARLRGVQGLRREGRVGLCRREQAEILPGHHNPPPPRMIYGPVRYPVASLGAVNTSNQLLADVISGKHHRGGLPPPTGLPLWVDVRDVALAHVRAVEVEEAAGRCFFVTAGHYSNVDLHRVLYKNFPELHDRLPGEAEKGGDPNPALKSFGYDNTQATAILGLEWTPYEKTIVDSAKSLLQAKP